MKNNFKTNRPVHYKVSFFFFRVTLLEEGIKNKSKFGRKSWKKVSWAKRWKKVGRKYTKVNYSIRSLPQIQPLLLHNLLSSTENIRGLTVD